MANVKRTPKNQAVMGMDITGIVTNPRAGAIKSLASGPQFLMPATATQLVAMDASAGLKLNPGMSLWLYNNSGTVAWASMANSNPTAPAGLTTGIPLKANDWTYLSLGEFSWLRTSAATVGVYIIADETSFTVETVE